MKSVTELVGGELSLPQRANGSLALEEDEGMVFSERH